MTPPRRELNTKGPLSMKQKRIGIIMHGVTGRMGMNQHLIRSVKAIRDQGGLELSDGTMLVPDIHIVGRNRDKIEALAAAHGIARYSTDLDAALANPDDEIFFDAASTQLRPQLLEKAIAAGKHVYSEKPVAEGLDQAVKIARLCKDKGVKNGIVHDKLDLPGLIKLKRLRDSGFFGTILSVKGDFGYWVFEGDWMEAQRPSWNYRQEDGGGIVSDMLPHWRYVLDNIVAPVKSVICTTATHIATRWDERGQEYVATADDAAYATFMLEGGIVAHINSSWCTRVRRDDLVTFQIDGTHGSAVAGLHKCYSQARVNTPKPVWNPDEPQALNFYESWEEVPDNQVFDNGFKVQWEQFLRHVAEDGPWAYSMAEGAKGVQLTEAGHRSMAERRWIDLEDLEI